MITAATLKDCKAWFAAYTRRFRRQDEVYNHNINLKIRHTRRVVREMRGLGAHLKLAPAQQYLAEVCALFHDIGRFEQYDRYGTYADNKSEDHGRLGVKVLEDHRVLAGCPATRPLVLKTVSYHNRRHLPDHEDESTLFYTKLVRDADKLDIFKVATEYYRVRDKKPNPSIELGFPNLPVISEKVVADLLAGRTVNMADIRSLNDFKLMQLGWINDLNFAFSQQRVRRKKYLQMIFKTLPPSAVTARIQAEFGSRM